MMIYNILLPIFRKRNRQSDHQDNMKINPFHKQALRIDNQPLTKGFVIYGKLPCNLYHIALLSASNGNAF